MDAPDLAIIVTSYQMPWHMRRVLESIAVQRVDCRLEVIVSDDGSTDETPRVVADFAAQSPFPVRFITHPHVGFHAGRCRNEGVRHSAASHLLFLDGDCLLPPDHIQQHLHAWRPGAATCSYCVRFDENLSQHATLEVVRSGRFTQWTTAEQRRKLRHMHFKSLWYGLIGHPTKPAFRSGNFSLARADFERVNGFDENFFGWGCEDDDFGRRLRTAGIHRVSVLNRTIVYHLWHPPTPTRPSEWKQGANVGYLQRPIRLTRCLDGCVKRLPNDLTVRLAGTPVDVDGLARLIAAHGWKIERSPKTWTDLEILPRPGNGHFGRHSDCRLLVIFDESLAGKVDTRAAHIVLSRTGQFGSPDQIRLALEDSAGLWTVIQGRSLPPQRAAA